MRIHNANTEYYVQALAYAVSKDPASMENWRCLHIQSAESTPFPWYEAALAQVKDAHKNLDCDVVHCSDNDMLLISRELRPDQLMELAHEIVGTDEEEMGESSTHEMTLYDVFRDWRTVREILFAKSGEVKAPVIRSDLPQEDFGDISSLQDVFAEARTLRRTRYPLHVMLVEDDPLTRRVVAAGFKENYALITAENAHEAVANYLMYAPDIVFLDIGLPDASGFSVLQQLMKSDPDAYVVMFSGNSYLDNVTSALSAGAAGFVAKPFKKEKLRHYIQDSALHHHKALN